MGLVDKYANWASDSIKRNRIKRPASVILLTIIYTFLGIFWIIVSYFGIWKLKKWGLYFAVGMSLLWVFGWFYVYLIKPPTDIVSIVLGSTIGLSMPITAAYVYWKHKTLF